MAVSLGATKGGLVQEVAEEVAKVVDKVVDKEVGEEALANVVGEEVDKEEDGNKMDNWWTDVVAVEGVHQEPAVTAE